MLRAAAVSVLVSSLVAVGTARAEEPGTIINLQERSPIAFLFGTFGSEQTHASSSEVIRVTAELLERHTDFSPQILDPSLLSRCGGRLLCLIEEVRQDYSRDALLQPDGTVLTYEHHVRRMIREHVAYPHFLLLVSLVPVEGGADRLTLLVVDTDVAVDQLHRADRKSAGWREEVDAQIHDTAVVFGPTRQVLEGAPEMTAYLERLFTKELAPVFERSDHWEPYGEISIETPSADFMIHLDGIAVGRTGKGVTRIVNVAPGVRELRLEHPDYEAFTRTLELLKQRVVVVEPDLVRRRSESGRVARNVTFWTGLGVAAGGAALLAITAARADGAVATYCFDGPSCRSTSAFQTTGYDPSVAAGLGPDVNGPGLLLAPLGLGLIGAGATWSLGSALFDGEGPPWLELAIGAAVGAATYALGAALDPGSGVGDGR